MAGQSREDAVLYEEHRHTTFGSREKLGEVGQVTNIVAVNGIV